MARPRLRAHVPRWLPRRRNAAVSRHGTSVNDIKARQGELQRSHRAARRSPHTIGTCREASDRLRRPRTPGHAHGHCRAIGRQHGEACRAGVLSHEPATASNHFGRRSRCFSIASIKVRRTVRPLRNRLAALLCRLRRQPVRGRAGQGDRAARSPASSRADVVVARILRLTMDAVAQAPSLRYQTCTDANDVVLRYRWTPYGRTPATPSPEWTYATQAQKTTH